MGMSEGKKVESPTLWAPALGPAPRHHLTRHTTSCSPRLSAAVLINEMGTLRLDEGK